MKSKEEIEQLASKTFIIKQFIGENDYNRNEIIAARYGYVNGYTQCQEDMADKDKWTFEEILDACYPTLGRGGDWAKIAIRLKEQKLNKQD